MMNVASEGIMQLRGGEKPLGDKEAAPIWGYAAQDLTPRLSKVRSDILEGLAEKDVMPAINRVHEQIDYFSADSEDPASTIFVRAAKAMLHFIDPHQYPEMHEVTAKYSNRVTAIA